MSLERRLALLQWANEADAFVIEDDYDSEFRYEGISKPALKALDGGNGRVVYIGTLSKLLVPGLRLGFMVAPDDLVDSLRTVRTSADYRVPSPLQATAAEFIGNGHLGAHIRRVRTLYTERRAALLAAIKSEGDGLLSVSTATAGLHLLAELPNHCDDQSIAAAAREKRIGVTPLSGYFVETPRKKQQGLLMGFGNTPARSMRGTIRMLRGLLSMK